jgi:hypothetical protein
VVSWSHEICANGPSVPEAVDRLVAVAHKHVKEQRHEH